MNITKITLHPVNNDGKTKAIGDIVIDDSLVVTGVRVVEGSNGAFASFPSKKNPKYQEGSTEAGKDKEYVDIVFPASKEARKTFNDAVVGEYEKMQTA